MQECEQQQNMDETANMALPLVIVTFAFNTMTPGFEKKNTSSRPSTSSLLVESSREILCLPSCRIIFEDSGLWRTFSGPFLLGFELRVQGFFCASGDTTSASNGLLGPKA